MAILTSSQSAPSHPVLLGGPACSPGLRPTEKGQQERCRGQLGPGSASTLCLACPQTEDTPSLGQPGVLTGMPCSCGLSSRLCSSFLEASIFSWSAASTMYLGRWVGTSMTPEVEQEWRKGCPEGLSHLWVLVHPGSEQVLRDCLGKCWGPLGLPISCPPKSYL